MSKAYVIAAAKTVDGQGCQADCLALEQKLLDAGAKVEELVIEPLSADWHSPEADNHFRSGCAPIEALARAKTLIAEGTELVVISGRDHIKSGYDRDLRLQKMAVYGDSYPLTQAYTELAEQFHRQHQLDGEQFKQIAYALFENYKLSYRNALADEFTPDQLPAERWYQPITSLFRGVDCANPLIDFSGRMLIANEDIIASLGLHTAQQVEVKAVGLRRLSGDGQSYINEIAGYAHLQQAYQTCCEEAGVDFAACFRRGDALLETYTCYPVVPMAFLLMSGLVDLLEDIPAFLDEHLITITGGMNLAKGPWNNPALNGLISMYHALQSGTEQYGMVHGNGGLGYRQGVALLSK